MEGFKKITIIGMGLMGGSMALALKKSGFKGKIIGCDASLETLKAAKTVGAVDRVYQAPEEAVKNTELLVLATPVGYYREVLAKTAPFLSKKVIVTDVGSVQGYVERIVEQYLPKDIQFIGGHPMAGSEQSGFRAASPFLYQNAYYFLTPKHDTHRDTIKKVRAFVEGLGAYPVVTDAGEHDQIAAGISHIPQLSAVLLASMLDGEKSRSYTSFVGGGFRDSTRIASGNPEMWKDIFLFNKKEVLVGIETLEGLLRDFKHNLAAEREGGILHRLQRAKRIRDGIPHSSKDYTPPLYELVLDVKDRPGILGDLTRLMGNNNINIKEIEILHAREDEGGALRMSFSSREMHTKARDILTKEGFSLTHQKGGGIADAEDQ